MARSRAPTVSALGDAGAVTEEQIVVSIAALPPADFKAPSLIYMSAVRNIKSTYAVSYGNRALPPLILSSRPQFSKVLTLLCAGFTSRPTRHHASFHR